MANGAEQQRVRKGRWQCAVGVFVSWRDERQQWCQMLSWGGGAGRTQKLEEDIENAWLWRPLRAAAKTDSATHTWSHTHTISNEHSTLVTVVCHFSLPAGQSRLKNSAAKGYCKTHRHAQTHTHTQTPQQTHTHTQCMPVSLCKPQSVKSQR